MRVLITGGAGMLGRALARAWNDVRPDDEVVALTRADADLRNRDSVTAAYRDAAPDFVLHTAARVGGIAANIASPVEFLADNLLIDTNVIESARTAGVRDLVYFGSSCMYPRDYRQPLVESDVLAAPLEPTNEGYAIAKIAGAKLAEYVSRQDGLNYRVLIPSNLYGPHDHFGSVGSHLAAAALYKAHVAKVEDSGVIDVWGDGTARREFTYVGDLGDWVAKEAGNISGWPALMNVGLGRDYSVAEFYRQALETVGYEAELRLDPTKPAGMHQKLMDSSLAARHGWSPPTDIGEGMALAYAAFLESDTEHTNR